MANIKMDPRDFQRLRIKMQHLKEKVPQLIEEATKEIAGKLLAEVIKGTPVGKYSRDVKFTTKDGKGVSFRTSYKKRGGSLRKGWTIGNIVNDGKTYTVEIINPVEYAWYVENGHRTVGNNFTRDEASAFKVGWVEGKFMFKIAKEEIEKEIPKILDRKLKKFFKEGG